MIVGSSRALRRQLGAVAWAVLEDLALVAHRGPTDWAAAVGVREVAKGIGINKDTAARAVGTLRAAGLVALTRVESPNGVSRSGYRLNLPEGIALSSCPAHPDSDSFRCQLNGLDCPEILDSNAPVHSVNVLADRTQLTLFGHADDGQTADPSPGPLSDQVPDHDRPVAPLPTTPAPDHSHEALAYTPHSRLPQPSAPHSVLLILTPTSADTSAPGGALLVSPASEVPFP
jgi:hypothetical protein